MEPKYVFRSTLSYGKLAVLGLFGVLILVATLVQNGLAAIPLTLLVIAGMMGIGFLFWFQPYLSVSPAGVVAHNLFRTVTVPFADLGVIEVRFGLRLTAKSTGRTYPVTAFAQSAFGLKRNPYEPGEEIPLVYSGTHSLTATTRRVWAFIEKMNDEFPVKGAERKARTSVVINWPHLGQLLLSVAAIIGPIMYYA